MLASTIIPSLIPKKKGSGISNKNFFFEQIKNKYPELFKKNKLSSKQYFYKQLIKK